LYTFPQPNIPYAGVVLLHAVGGVIASILLIPTLLRVLRNGSFSLGAGWLLIAAGAVLGLVLIKTGASRAEWNKLYFHIIISLAGVGFLIASWPGRRTEPASLSGAVRAVICLAVLARFG